MNTNVIETKRNIYTASPFAKKSLIYLNEVGRTKSLKLHTTSRPSQVSYLLLVVEDGDGKFYYNNKTYKLQKGNIVFVDCRLGFKHQSSNWTISWIHFNGYNMPDIYTKYLERKGSNIIFNNNFNLYSSLIDEIFMASVSTDYLKDYTIYEKIVSLTSLVMSETLFKDENSKHKYNIKDIKDYLSSHYLEDIYLDDLSENFLINKYYLTRAFKNEYGKTIGEYINEMRIKKAKELLRFSSLSILQISESLNFTDVSYFSRLFKKIEQITPNEYRKTWQ